MLCAKSLSSHCASWVSLSLTLHLWNPSLHSQVHKDTPHPPPTPPVPGSGEQCILSLCLVFGTCPTTLSSWVVCTVFSSDLACFYHWDINFSLRLRYFIPSLRLSQHFKHMHTCAQYSKTHSRQKRPVEIKGTAMTQHIRGPWCYLILWTICVGSKSSIKQKSIESDDINIWISRKAISQPAETIGVSIKIFITSL